EQHRPAALADRALAIVELHPQPRLRDPRPRAAPVTLPPPPLRISHPPPRHPRRTLIADRDQPAVRDIRPDPPRRTVDQLMDLRLKDLRHRRPLALHGRPPARELALMHPI